MNAMFESRAAGGRLSKVARTIVDADAHALAARLTWVVFLLDPIGHPIADLPLTLLAIIGLAARRLETHALLWWVSTLLCAVPVIDDWTGVDNHAFLRVYWALALAIAATVEDSGAVLARNARGLIGAAFAFAVLWKGVLSPDFVDGTYFRFTFLTDLRFVDWSALLGGLDPADHALNRERLIAWLSSPDAVWESGFVEPTGIATLAHATVLWTLAIEAAVAIGFCWPSGQGPGRYRDFALLLFGITTYAVATVEGFGWLLCCMGIAQCDPRRPRLALAYLGLFASILCYARVLWASVLQHLAGV